MKDSLADVVERMMSEFEGAVSLDVISETVLAAARDLAGTHVDARAELVERSVRQRLIDLGPIVDLGPIDLDRGGPV
jgi:hypothetical protein